MKMQGTKGQPGFGKKQTGFSAKVGKGSSKTFGKSVASPAK